MRAALDEVRRFLTLLARPGDVFELRGLARGRSSPVVHAGFFDDMGALAVAAAERSGRDDGVYITLNPVNPALLARAPANRVRQAGNGDTTSDRDVAHRRHLLVDVDPVRPAGISSTESEHANAIALADTIAAELAAAGWPAPIRADSGNGGHLIYAIDLPVDDGGLVKRVLAELSRRYTTSALKVDEKVFNPARISKIYGTLTRKGENTEDRPHRIARVLAAPDALAVVDRAVLEAFAPAAAAPARTGAPTPRPYRADAPRFDLDAWIATHLPDALPMSWSEGRKWLLPVCPFNSDHGRREAYITEKHGGMIAAGCQHESCFKSWRELRLHFEPDAYQGHEERLRAVGRQVVDAGPRARLTDREPPPEVLYEDPSYQAELDAFAARDREEAGPPPPRADADPRPKEWPEPRPLPGRALAAVPAFDLDLLPRELRFWVEDAAERMQVAPDIIAVAAMCALSIVAANARTIHPKRYDNWRVYPVLWGVAIAPAGSMKSPAIAIVEKLIAKVEIAERERHEAKRYERQAAEMLGKAQEDAIRKRVKASVAGKEDAIDPKALAAELRERDLAAATNAKERRLRTTDATVEKLGMLVENGKRRCRPMIVWCDELGGLLHSFEREGRESDRDFYLAGWSVSNHTVDRVARGSLFLRDLAVSIFGAMTPGPFEKYVREATGGESADGFLQRMQLMVYPDQSREWKPIDRSPDRPAEHRAIGLFERMFAIDEDDEHGRPPALRFTAEAQELFDGWFAALEHRLRDPSNGLSEARRSHLAKYRSLMPAIALVCHLADGPGAEHEHVSIGAARRAIAWCAYLEAHADRVYSLANDNTWLDAEIVRRIQTGKLTGTIKLRKIQRALPDSVKAEDLAAACEALEEHGWLVLETVKQKTGRPYQVAHINPRGVSS